MDSRYLSILASFTSPLHFTFVSSHQSSQITSTSSLANGKAFTSGLALYQVILVIVGPVWSYLNVIKMS